jgi:catechol 2,3-dioxygenase-like lactoylglutathione lyase family enzyme
MKPRLSVLTLAVDDLDRSLAFYHDGLGFPTAGIIGTQFEHGAVVFIDLLPGLKLALWPRASLEHDSGVSCSPQRSAEVWLGHNVHTREEVDAVMAQAQRAGARIVKPAQPTIWGGYAGYFQDPDGHLWEIVWNPAFEIVD